MEKEFKNTFLQNTLVIVGTIVTMLLLETFLKTNMMIQIAYAINPHNGFSIVLTIATLFIVFGLPFKAVRKAIWNIVGSVVSIRPNIKGKPSIPTRKPKAVKGQIIHVDEDLAPYRDNVKVNKQHYKIKL